MVLASVLFPQVQRWCKQVFSFLRSSDGASRCSLSSGLAMVVASVLFPQVQRCASKCSLSSGLAMVLASVLVHQV
ncbi:hypothetical protein RRG08_038660 [Elysia crispata]|uniref:Uncharacterized protein n=1 Tax=Elysia crispata TaxID=231223 RepID=A0AAE1AGI4_9GAST|nr:hypothetical protein RRG08_038660 [Elysia crispata]